MHSSVKYILSREEAEEDITRPLKGVQKVANSSG